MKKFVFDLQDILDIRKFEQQQAEIELGKALGVENEIQQKLNALAVRQASIQKTMKGSTDFNDIASANQFFQAQLVKPQGEVFEEIALVGIVAIAKHHLVPEVRPVVL
jgi:flagellar FliJ protein